MRGSEETNRRTPVIKYQVRCACSTGRGLNLSIFLCDRRFFCRQHSTSTLKCDVPFITSHSPRGGEPGLPRYMYARAPPVQPEGPRSRPRGLNLAGARAIDTPQHMCPTCSPSGAVPGVKVGQRSLRGAPGRSGGPCDTLRARTTGYGAGY